MSDWWPHRDWRQLGKTKKNKCFPALPANHGASGPPAAIQALWMIVGRCRSFHPHSTLGLDVSWLAPAQLLPVCFLCPKFVHVLQKSH